MSKVLSYAEKERDVQNTYAKYHEIMEPLGRPAPRPFPEEDKRQYKERALPILQSLVPGFKNLEIDSYLRDPNLKYIEQQIFEAARQEIKHPTRIPEGTIREVVKYDQSGRPMIEFYGSPSAWMQNFTDPRKRTVAKINTETNRSYIPTRYIKE